MIAVSHSEESHLKKCEKRKQTPPQKFSYV